METNQQQEASQAKPVGIAGVLAGQSIDGEAPKGDTTDQGETKEAADGETTEGGDAAQGEGQAAAEAQAKPGDAKEEAGNEASPEVRGVLKGIQAERQKRQAAERERDELRAQIAQLTGQALPEETGEPQRPTTDLVTERRILTISENSARRAHPDFEEKFKTFAAEAEKNPALYDVVMGSDDPGEAAYQAGKTLQLQQKYGTDPEAMVSKVKEETETQMRDRIRKEVEAELSEKISTKNNQPKNILAGRAAGKAEQETVPALTFQQLLAKRKG